jgi:zinc D-Ala-D-Ala carboxypeptidase|tara:strand:- start:191 stop:706 length:516 start_codon:yes stop_codon:yes gene_type:complete
MRLSQNFTLAEMIKSQTAERKGINNNPNEDNIENLQRLCNEILQPIRDHYGKVVSVSSGFRSPELCVAIGSSVTSQHASGQAADFEIYGVSNKELADYIADNLDFDQLILEYWKPEEPNSGWVHCSYKGSDSNRKEYLRAVKGADGRTSYQKEYSDSKGPSKDDVVDSLMN